MKVRTARIDDLTLLVEFNQSMAMETESKQLDKDKLSAGVGHILADKTKGFYLVAEDEHEDLAGSLMVTYEWSDWRNAQFWWIQSVYVQPKFRRQGVYKKLYQKVQELAKQQDNVCGFRLYVEKDNHVAQETYKSLGMHASHYDMFETD